MSKSKKVQSIQGPLLIKIETFPKSGKNKRCFADCTEKCHQKSYTIFDPKPHRKKSETEDEHSKESVGKTQSSVPPLLTNQREPHFQPSLETSTRSSIHSQQENNLSDYEELSAVESEQLLHINNSENSKDSEIVNTLTKNIEQTMTRSSETRYEEYKNSDQRMSEMPPNELMTPEAKNSIIQYCKPTIEMEKKCLCSEFSKGQKRTNTDIMNIPKKLLRPCNKNGIKFCSKKLDQETNPDYTIEISVELAQNKKKKASQIETKQKQAGIVDPNETSRTDENYNKSPKFSTNIDQNDNYIAEKPEYPDSSKQQRIDYPTKIAKISDRRTLTARQPKSMNQPEEISISVDTSRVEISTDEGKQTLLTNKRTTTIRSSYSEWDADEPAEQPKALMDSSDRGSIRSTGQKPISSQRKPIDTQYSGYHSDQDDGSPQYLQYKENEKGRDEMSDKLQKKLFTQNEQLPGKSSRDSAVKSIGSKQIEGTLYKRTTKMRTDGDINQPDKFSVISEVEEGELYLTPESRKKTIASEADPYMTKLFEQEPGAVKPYRHLSKELDEVMDPDQWSFDEQDIVEKRRNLFERARALSAGLLERARSLSAAAKSEREHESIAPTTRRGQVSSAEESEDYSQRRGERIRNKGVSTFSPMTLSSYVDEDGLSNKPEGYQDRNFPPNIEMEQQSRGTYRPLQSAPPSAGPMLRNIAVSTFSPPISLASFVERNQQGSKGRYATPGTIEGEIQSRGRQSPLSTASRGYPTSQEPSHVVEDASSRDEYYAGSLVHPDGYPSSEVPSRTGSKDRYPGGSSAQADGYPTSGLSSRVGSRDMYPAGALAHPDGSRASEPPSRAGSRDRYPGGSSAYPDGYQSNVPSRAGSRDRYPDGSLAHPDEYQTSGVPSRAGSKDTYRSSSRPDGYQSNVPSRAGSREEYHGGSTAHSDGFRTSEVSSRAGSRDTFTAGSLAHPDGYQSYVPSRAGSKDRYPAGSVGQPDGYRSSEVSSRAGSREPSSRYPSIRSGVGSSTTIDDGIAAPQMHLPYRDFGASTTSPMSFDSYIERVRRSRISSPAVSIQPIAQREPDIPSTIEPDYESQGSHRPTGSVLVSEEAEEYSESETTPSYTTKEDATKAAIFQPYATIVPLKEYPKSGCFLELCVLEKHIYGCPNKRKVGEEDQFCGYDVLSRQIFQTCQESSIPFMPEEEVLGKSTVGSLQSGRKRPDSLASEPTPTEELISETRATPVYSEKRGVTESESKDSYAPSEVTSGDTQAKAEEEERLRKEALRKEEEEERLRRAALRKEEEEERLKRAALAKKEEDENIRRTSSGTKTSMGGSDKDKSDVISDTDTVVSSVTSKKSSFSGHLPDFRNMPVKPPPIDRKPTSVFSKWFKNLPCKSEKKEKKEGNKEENKEENEKENK